MSKYYAIPKNSTSLPQTVSAMQLCPDNMDIDEMHNTYELIVVEYTYIHGETKFVLQTKHINDLVENLIKYIYSNVMLRGNKLIISEENYFRDVPESQKIKFTEFPTAKDFLETIRFCKDFTKARRGDCFVVDHMPDKNAEINFISKLITVTDDMIIFTDAAIHNLLTTTNDGNL